jgi:hypothetical protein
MTLCKQCTIISSATDEKRDTPSFILYLIYVYEVILCYAVVAKYKVEFLVITGVKIRLRIVA